MYYGPTILKMAGFGNEDNIEETLILSIPLALVNALGTLIAIYFTDKLGRRFIILRTTFPMAGALLVLATGLGLYSFCSDLMLQNLGSWLSLVGMVLYLIFFSIGMGNAPWTINSEIYPLHLRGAGMSCSTFSNWGFNYCVSQLFLTLTATPVGEVCTFAGLSLMAVCTWMFTYFYIPETKGRTIEDIVEELCPNSRRINSREYERYSDEVGES
mmetsp:Transcript_42630/g.40919  ORF Transcript_42630/g.40919 Transcript_42630/m.40919 type:complete len:214 (+) Transcript_42630:666-1307(+)